MREPDFEKQIREKSPGLSGEEIFWLTCEIRTLNPYDSTALFKLLNSLLGEKKDG